MTLLSPILMLFALSAAVPLVLHLYQRRKKVVLDFSTNRFFTQAIVRSQRRMKLRRWFLLLLRMAACMAIPLAAAGPVMSLLGTGEHQGNRDLVLVIDDSLSMNQPCADNITRLDRAKAIAGNILASLGGGDRAVLLSTTQNIDSGELSSDTAALGAELARVRPTFAAGDPVGVLGRSALLFNNDQSRSRKVLIISDMQAGDWRSIPWPQPRQPTDVVTLTVAPPATGGLSVLDASLLQVGAVVGQPNGLMVRVVNASSQSAVGEISIQVNDKVISRRELHVPGSSTDVHQVPVTFDRPGDHRVVVAIARTAPDAPGARFYLTAHVSADLPVLIVDDALGGKNSVPDAVVRQSGAFFLRAALQAAGCEQGNTQGIRVDVIASTELGARSLDGYRAVFLCDVGEVPIPAAEALRAFVRRGGGLAIFPGPQTQPQALNNSLGRADSFAPLLPATLGQLVTPEQLGQFDRSIRILQADTSHPVLARFTGSQRGSLSGVAIYKAYTLEPHDAWTIASMDKSLPLIVERSVGAGRVMMFAVSPSPDWTNLPLRRAFIPLVSRTVGYLAGSGAARLPGVCGRELMLAQGAYDPAQPPMATLPGGGIIASSTRLIGSEVQAYLPGRLVDRPGYYSVAPPPRGRASTTSSVNVPGGELQTAVLDPATTTPLAGSWQLQSIDLTGPLNDPATGAALASAIASSRAGSGVWDLVLWLALGVVLVEPFIADGLAFIRGKFVKPVLPGDPTTLGVPT